MGTCLVSSQAISRSLETFGSLPQCAIACQDIVFPTSNISRSDVNGICNDPVFFDAITACEKSTCNSIELQQITALAAIVCSAFGGVQSSVYKERYPNIPDCANNCTSTAIVATNCKFGNTTCACTAPNFINAFGPCVAAACSEADQNAFNSQAQASCDAVGGNGPYNASQIGGYLNYTNPNGTAPPVPLLNSTATNTTATPPISFTGAAASMFCIDGGVWRMLGLMICITMIV